MEKSPLIEKSKKFAIEVIMLCESIKGKASITNQLIRSGTSIGANIREANYAHSKADFIAKFQIALKECYETEYWLELLFETNSISDDIFKEFQQHAGTIRRMLISSINTAKGKK
ncbi:MAG: four helix bundle protein [Firmicutes bacterium]|nr:four helix bundle protein [Bacillota bacterium]